MRKALNTVELIVLSGEQTEDGIAISGELTQELTQRSNMRYDRDNDQHYDLLSALQKSHPRLRRKCSPALHSTAAGSK